MPPAATAVAAPTSNTLPSLSSTGKGRVTLTRAQVDESLERLYSHPMKQYRKQNEEYRAEVQAKALKPLQLPRPHGALSPTETRMVDELYDQALKRRATHMEQLKQKYDYVLPKVMKKTDDETHESLDRLYTQGMVQKKQAMKNAEIRLYGAPAASRGLSKEELENCVDKLYQKSMEKRKEHQEKIDEEFCFKPPSSKRLPQAELDALVERLKQNPK